MLGPDYSERSVALSLKIYDSTEISLNRWCTRLPHSETPTHEIFPPFSENLTDKANMQRGYLSKFPPKMHEAIFVLTQSRRSRVTRSLIRRRCRCIRNEHDTKMLIYLSVFIHLSALEACTGSASQKRSFARSGRVEFAKFVVTISRTHSDQLYYRGVLLTQFRDPRLFHPPKTWGCAWIPPLS